MERDAAEKEAITSDRAAPRLGGIAYRGDVGNPKRQPAHDLVVALAEAEAAIRQFQLRFAVRTSAGGSTDDLAPVLGQSRRIRTLHLDFYQGLRHVLADRLLPIRP